VARKGPAGKTTQIAVLGTGSIGSRHLDVLNAADGFSTIAVPLRPGRARELANQGQETAAGLAEAADMGAGICVIATETGRHLEDGILALDHGFDLLVEKPLTPTAPDSKDLLSHAKSVGHSLYVGCVMRFSESLGTFREYLAQIGQLHSVRIECQSYLPEWRPQRSYLESYAARNNEGGVLLDLIHEVDYAGWIYGWPQAVQGRVRNLGRLGIAADEAVELSWESPACCLVSINLDYLSRQPRRIMRAYGSLGTIEWEGFGGTVTLMVEGEERKIVESQQARNDTFLAQMQAFVEALQGAHDPRLATAEEGAWGLAVCDAARNASVSRREIEVAYT
jgi:predicted dehydrogenase